ncbi:MinD/ParA family protein [Halalkalibacterium ligniniphilum]|uniref:MinD/ParA family protein n=1 Tax=Halalkalibacterium ligniniphilum TaxID=1134413 RepID=UPI00034D204C|nr:MinD/ParA family protein [Halalkalibacterium ligniniphilum]
MNDQAESLRRIMNESSQTEAKVIAVVSGKGGVGKSNVSLNFAIALAKRGKRVAVIDLDIGMANLDILMGLQPSYHIVDMIERELTIWDIAEAGPEGIYYIAGGSGLSTLVKLNEEKIQRFLQQLESAAKSFDYIFLDMGAGATAESLQFILAAHEVFVVTTPEPTSITDAYAMVKYIHQQGEDSTLSLLVNRADSKQEGERTAANFQRVVNHFLAKEMRLLGYLPQDHEVIRAVKAQTPFLLFNPKAKSSVAIEDIAAAYLGLDKSLEHKGLNSFMSRLRRFFR